MVTTHNEPELRTARLAHRHTLVWNPHWGRIAHHVLLIPTGKPTELVHGEEGGLPTTELLNRRVERLKPLVAFLEVARAQRAAAHAGGDAELVLELLSSGNVHVQLAQLNCVAQSQGSSVARSYNHCETLHRCVFVESQSIT